MTVTSTEVADLDYITTMEMDGWAVRHILPSPNNDLLDVGETLEFVVVFERETTDKWYKQDRRRQSNAAFVVYKGEAE